MPDYNPFETINQRFDNLEKQNAELIAMIKAMTSIDVNETLSVHDVSEELGVSVLTVRNYIKRGTIPASKIGRRVLIKRSDLSESLQGIKSLKYKR